MSAPAGGRSVALILSILSGMLLILLTMSIILSKAERESLNLERDLEQFSLDFISMNAQGFSRFAAAIAMDKPLQHFYESRPERKLKQFRKQYRTARQNSTPKLRMLQVNKHYRRFRKALLTMIDYRRTFWAEKGQEIPVSEWLKKNKELDDEYHRQYSKFITKLRTINRRSYFGLVATIAVLAVAASLELVLLMGLGLVAVDILCRRLFGPNLFRFDTNFEQGSHRDDDVIYRPGTRDVDEEEEQLLQLVSLKGRPSRRALRGGVSLGATKHHDEELRPSSPPQNHHNNNIRKQHLPSSSRQKGSIENSSSNLHSASS
eukprot:CAMPEP_0197295800 /NCGR_PEP_ID=MMETSP0890-20130614/36525_1 /TAXON_ID=44058 ORGANISM="Aureoumbra lagunensis, Strain CCMP1510" /NCGR_SAMPLE_ID=MMETSP0890 /ASSEMBLY_ACC=CAM_ASM_000533 /LENGTH=318 /DNA_ID=CAMNT_0042771985 /DNA_START=1204 /DNA_END=2156 /DNA_ORIENTATION=+